MGLLGQQHSNRQHQHPYVLRVIDTIMLDPASSSKSSSTESNESNLQNFDPSNQLAAAGVSEPTPAEPTQADPPPQQQASPIGTPAQFQTVLAAAACIHGDEWWKHV